MLEERDSEVGVRRARSIVWEGSSAAKNPDIRESRKATRRRSTNAKCDESGMEESLETRNEGRADKAEGRDVDAVGAALAKRSLVKSMMEDKGGSRATGPIFAASFSSGGIFL